MCGTVKTADKNFWNPDFDFVKVVLKTSDGEKVINFSDYESFYKVFTPQRVEILTVLAKQNIKSVNNLIKIVGRDSKTVRNDLSVLEATGLIRFKREKNRKIPEPTFEKMTVSLDFEKIFPYTKGREAKLTLPP